MSDNERSIDAVSSKYAELSGESVGNEVAKLSSES